MIRSLRGGVKRHPVLVGDEGVSPPRKTRKLRHFSELFLGKSEATL
jgi:hypothetical protein